LKETHRVHEHKRTTTLKETKPTPTKNAHNPNPLTKMFTKIGKRSGTLQRKRQWHTIADNGNTNAQSNKHNNFRKSHQPNRKPEKTQLQKRKMRMQTKT